MNPDNPNFRTPEEEARAAELVRLKAEIERLKEEDAAMVSRLHAQSKIMSEKDAEIAKLKRVNAKLTEQRNRAADRHHKQSLAKYRERIAQFEAELEAIEQGEGM